MNLKWGALFATLLSFLLVRALSAQDLGPGFTKVKDGIYVYAPDQTTTTCSIILTQTGRAQDRLGANIDVAYKSVLSRVFG